MNGTSTQNFSRRNCFNKIEYSLPRSFAIAEQTIVKLADIFGNNANIVRERDFIGEMYFRVKMYYFFSICLMIEGKSLYKSQFLDELASVPKFAINVLESSRWN